jgi:hypothetical protein
VHTIESDLTELAKLSDGKKVTFGRYTYLIRNGRFFLMNYN